MDELYPGLKGENVMMMKSALVLAIMMILTIAVCGCTNSTTTANNTNNSLQELHQSPAQDNTKEPATPPAAAGSNTSGTPEKKTLVAYFSHSGNTRVMANYIHEGAGGDIFEIKTVDPYPQDYEAVKAKAMQELNDGYRPLLAENVEDMGSYDVIFVGYPNWWGTMPMAVESFLTGYDLSGKTIIPFCTHDGSGLGSSVRDIRTLCPQSTVTDGLAIRGSSVNNAQDQVVSWLRATGYYRK